MLVPKLRFRKEDGTEYPEWEKKQFGKIMSCYSGGTPSSKNKQYYNGDIPFIRSGEIHSSKTELFLSEEGLNNSAAKMVNIGDLIYALYGATSGEVDISKINGAINQAILCIVPHNDNRIYLKYWLECFKTIITSRLLQGGQGNLSGELIKGLLINIPCLEEQQKIADFLSTVDEVIAQSEKEVQNLEQQKKAAMQKIFSQEVRFRRDDGTEYPEWEEKKLGELTLQITTRNKDNASYPVYSVSNIRGFIPQSEQFEDREVASKDKTNYKIVEYHHFAYNPSRINVGSIAYLKDRKAVIVSPLYVVFECTEITPEYLSLYVKTQDFHNQRKSKTAGSVRDSLNYKGFSEITISVPCLEEQQKIADFLSTYDEAISYEKQELDKWNELKKGLLQQMFV